MPKTRGPTCGTHPRSKHWVSTDCCGWVCAILTWFFLGFAAYIIYFRVLRPWKGDPFSTDNPPTDGGWFHYIGFFSCIFLSYWSHIKTMLTDPGAVPIDAIPLDYYNEPPFAGKFQQHHEICRICDSYKPRTAHHCSICSRCIVRMDHHCPWANNCIGQTNHKFFILFITYTFISCVWALILIISKSIHCSQGLKFDSSSHKFTQTIEVCKGNDNPGDTLFIILVGIEAFFFGMFTICMICDQAAVVSSGQSHIDVHKQKRVLKKEEVKASTMSENFATVFGGDGQPSIWWFVPIDAKWKNPEKHFGFMLPKKHHDPEAEKEHYLQNLGNSEPTDGLLNRGEKSLDDLV